MYTNKPSDDNADTTPSPTTATVNSSKSSRSRVTSPDYSDEEPLKVWVAYTGTTSSPTTEPTTVTVEPTVPIKTTTLPTLTPTTNPEPGTTVEENFLNVQVAYTVVTDECGHLDANTFMSLAGNFSRQGLIDKTTNLTTIILNQTIHNVTIDQAFDVNTGCGNESSCLFVTSTISVMLGPDDNPAMINNAIKTGLQDSFDLSCKVLVSRGRRKKREPSLFYAPHSSLQVQVSYNFTNDCGFDAEDIMNEIENSMKQDLIKATWAIVNRALKETTSSLDSAVQLTEQQPITIDQILNIDQDCKQGLNCLFVTSAISLDGYGENPALVIATVTKGMRESFEDGSFFDELPDDTADCLPV